MSEMTAMKSVLALFLVLAAGSAHAQLTLPPDEDRAPSRLAPMDPASPWHPRFESAARSLQPALASANEAYWLPLFGGQWLGADDRARIGAALNDEAGAFKRIFSSRSASEFTILGWQPPEGGEAYASLADRPEGDAIICWRPSGGPRDWPQTAAEAEDGSAHACVRLSYSVRFDPPQWRAFLDAPTRAD